MAVRLFGCLPQNDPWHALSFRRFKWRNGGLAGGVPSAKQWLQHEVTLVESQDSGIIGVGEGSTPLLRAEEVVAKLNVWHLESTVRGVNVNPTALLTFGSAIERW